MKFSRFLLLVAALLGSALLAPLLRAVTLSLPVPSTASATTTPNAGTLIPSLSADGRYLTFASNSNDITSGITDNNTTNPDIYQKDLQTGVVTLVSRSQSSATAGMNNRFTGAPRASDDGAYVFFASDSTNLVGGTGSPQEAYLWSRSSGQVIRVAAVQTQGLNISGDGNWLGLYTQGPMPKNIYDGGQGSFATTAGNYNLYLVDRVTGAVTVATHPAGSPGTPMSPIGLQSIVLSADGRYSAFEVGAVVSGWDTYTGTYVTNSEAIYLYDRVADTMALVTKRNDGSAPSALVINPTVQSISPDGRYVYFHHGDIDFGTASADSNTTIDMYRYDRDGGSTRLARYFPDVLGIAANNATLASDISANGRWMAFLSAATNLVSGDTNARQDVFLLDTTDNSIRRMNLTGETEWTGTFNVGLPQVDNAGQVMFQSTATGIGFTDTNAVNDTFRALAVIADTTAPTVSSVTASTADGTWTTGDVLSLRVVFSESVIVTGTPQLALNSGGTAAYLSGSGSATLTFSYTVAAGHTSADLDYAATSSLTLNGGTIRDAANNSAVLTLASPGAAGSLGANKALVIDTTPPSVTSIVRLTPSSQTTAATSVTFRVTYSEPVLGVSLSSFSVAAVNSDIVGTISNVSGSGTIYDVTVSISSGSGEFRLTVLN